MTKEQILNYKIKDVNFYKFNYIYASVISIVLIIFVSFFSKFENNISDNIILIFTILFFIAIFFIYAKINGNNRTKDRFFFNSIIILGQEIIKTNKNSIDYYLSEIIEKKINSYNQEFWEVKEKEMGYPNKISKGDFYVFEIISLANEENINSSIEKYENFDLKTINEKRGELNYFNGEIKNRNKLVDIQEKLVENYSKLGGENLSNYLEQEEKNEIEQKKKQIKNNQRNLQLVAGICPNCLTKIPRLASKCPNCTADL